MAVDTEYRLPRWRNRLARRTYRQYTGLLAWETCGGCEFDSSPEAACFFKAATWFIASWSSNKVMHARYKAEADPFLSFLPVLYLFLYVFFILINNCYQLINTIWISMFLWNFVAHIHCMTFLSSGCINAADLISVDSNINNVWISENPESVTWPWWLTLKMKAKHQGRIQRVLRGGGGANYGERGSASLYGGLGACPQWGPGAKPLVRGQGDEVPLKLTRFCYSKFKFLMKNAPFLRNLDRIHNGGVQGQSRWSGGQRDEVPLKLTRFCYSKFKFLMKNAPFLRNLKQKDYYEYYKSYSYQWTK